MAAKIQNGGYQQCILDFYIFPVSQKRVFCGREVRVVGGVDGDQAEGRGEPGDRGSLYPVIFDGLTPVMNINKPRSKLGKFKAGKAKTGLSTDAKFLVNVTDVELELDVEKIAGFHDTSEENVEIPPRNCSVVDLELSVDDIPSENVHTYKSCKDLNNDYLKLGGRRLSTLHTRFLYQYLSLEINAPK